MRKRRFLMQSSGRIDLTARDFVLYNHSMLSRRERVEQAAQEDLSVRYRILAAMILAGCLLLAGWTGTARAADVAGTAAFHQGSLRVSLLFGGGRAFDRDYRVFGAGIGYYVVDGLEAGLEAETWQGNDPGITRVSPQLMYVFPLGREARPYAGAFYRKSFIDGYKDLNDAGGRAGMLFLLGGSAYLGAGLVYERHIGCDRAVYDSCSEAYPELLIALIF